MTLKSICLSDGTWYEYDAGLQFLDSLHLRNTKDVDVVIARLRAERCDIELQIVQRKEQLGVHTSCPSFVNWKIKALTALRHKAKQIAYLKDLRNQLDQGTSNQVWGIANQLSNYILKLPDYVVVPVDIMQAVVELDKLNKASKKEKSNEP